MAKEIERKFLLKKGASIPIPESYSKFRISQAYMLAQKNKQVRIRLTYKDAVIGVKFTGGIVRDEFEYKIPLEDGKVIYSKCKLQVEKNRLSFNSGSEHYDVDTFPNGFVVVEVEFKSLTTMAAWNKPSWLGKEVTNDSKYSNITLAKKKLKFKNE